MGSDFLLNMPKTNYHMKIRDENQKRKPFELIPYKNISFYMFYIFEREK